MGLQHLLLGKPDARLKSRWLEHIRTYGPGQCKPNPGPFPVPAHITRHPLRIFGGALRKQSGLALRAPEHGSAERFKIWEMPGEEYFPRTPRALLGQELDIMFRDYLPSFKSERSFVLRIAQGLFHGHDHSLFDADYKLIDWETPYWALACGLPSTMFRGRLPQPKRLKGRTLVLSAPGATNNIWHLLFDALPKLHLVQRAGLDPLGFDHYLINSKQARFERDALEMLGLPPEKIVESDAVPLVQSDEMFFVTLGFVIPTEPWVLHWVRSKFLGPESGHLQDKRVFLSRADATRRRFRDEHLLWDKLREKGFEKVEFATMGLAEQIDCMRRAEVVVAPHGAGLTNLVWSAPGTKVAELFAKEYINACYWLIADMLGQDYAFAIG
ncbi:MAG: glycosyltransferase family 61 protein, partial [Chthoniobacterales bacterium]